MAKAKQLPSGSWRVQKFAGTDAYGKRVYKSFTADTPEEAEFLAAKYALDHKDDKKKKSAALSMTLGEAIDEYISVKSGVLSPKTVREYKRFRRIYAQGIINVKLDDITSEVLQREISRESARLSPKSVSNIYDLISASLKMQMPEKLFSVKLPQKVKKEIIIPTNEDLKKIMAAVEGTRLEIPVLLGSCLGMRRSEIAALDLSSDVNYEKGTVTISKAMVNDSDGNWVIKSPKAYASYRTIEAPGFVIDKLRTARDNPDYKMMNPAHISSAFIRKAKHLGLAISFHDLRHYYASAMLALGVPDKYAAERMGHNTTNMLKTVYQHLFDEKKREVSTAINEHFNAMQHEMQHDN